MKDILIIVTGLFAGSFLYCISISGISLRRSRCESCGHELSCHDLIPVISFIMLKGRCRYCRERLDVMYPLSECVTAAVYVLVFRRYGNSTALYEYLILASVMLMISFRDLKDMTIPDVLIAAAMIDHLMFHPGTAFNDAMTGTIVSGTLLILTLLMEKLYRKEMMGLGDVKLVFALGMKVSVYCSVMALFIASLSALAIEMFRKRGPFPFGPYICLGYLAVFVFLQ